MKISVKLSQMQTV